MHIGHGPRQGTAPDCGSVILSRPVKIIATELWRCCRVSLGSIDLLTEHDNRLSAEKAQLHSHIMTSRFCRKYLTIFGLYITQIRANKETRRKFWNTYILKNGWTEYTKHKHKTVTHTPYTHTNTDKTQITHSIKALPPGKAEPWHPSSAPTLNHDTRYLHRMPQLHLVQIWSNRKSQSSGSEPCTRLCVTE